MFGFIVSKVMENQNNNDKRIIPAQHIFWYLIVKDLKISVEQGSVVTTLNMIKH